MGTPLHTPPSQIHRIWETTIIVSIFEMRELVSRDSQGPELISVWIKNPQATSPFSEIRLSCLAGLASEKPGPAEALDPKRLSVTD